MLSGRAREVAEIEAALAAGRAGAAAIVLEGEAGIGKTALWTHGLELAADGGQRVLRARAVPAETTLSYSVLADLLAPVPDDVFARLAPVQRGALDVALLRRLPTRSSLDARAVAAGLMSVLDLLAAAAPVVVGLDDLQWIDRSSARAIGAALRRLTDQRVAVLATLRTGGATPTADLVSALPVDTRRVRVAGLPRAALRDVLSTRTGGALRPALAARVVDASGGNPLHALEIARLVAAEAVSATDPLPVPDELRATVQRRVSRLPRPTRDALLELALRGRSDGVPISDLAVFGPAEEAGTVVVDAQRRVRFAHPLFSAAIVSAASRQRRRLVHAELAEQATSLEERAVHLASSTDGPDEGVAAVLDDAALDADRRGAPDVAAALAELALGFTPPDDDVSLGARALRAGVHKMKVGDVAGARRRAEEVLARVPAGPVRARGLQLLAVAGLSDHVAGQLELIVEALDHVGDDHRLASELHVQRGMLHLTQFQSVEASASGAAALAAAEASGDDDILAEALGWCAMATVLAGHPLDLGTLERALALEDPGRDGPFQLRASTLVSTAYTWLGHLDEARLVAERLDGHLVAAGREGDRPFALGQLAIVELGAGNWTLAAEYARRSAEFATTYEQPIFVAQASGVLGLILASSGDEARANAELDRVAEFVERAQWTVGYTYVVHGRAELAFLRGDHEGAWAILEPLVAAVQALGVLEWVHAVAMPNAVEVLVALGRLDDAQRLAGALVAYGERGRRRWATAIGLRCRAIVADAAGDVEAAAAAGSAALAAHAELPMQMELARTLLVVGRIERRRNARRAAREHFTRAAELARRSGATPWAELAELELSRMAGRARDRTDLTATELAVARLVAQGFTNAETATQLHMSVKTVEAHLGHVYRKLRVRRAELGVALAARPAS